jgi:hypothetical protein
MLAFEPSTMSTAAGGQTASYYGDGTDPTAATLGTPYGLALDTNGDFFIADYSDKNLWFVSATGISSLTFSGYTFTAPVGVQVDSQSNLFVNDNNQYVVEIPSSTGVPSNYLDAQNGDVTGFTLDGAGDAYIADGNSGQIYGVQAGTSALNLLLGTSPGGCSGDGGPALYASSNGATGLRVDAFNNLYFIDCNEVRVLYASGSAAAALISIENPGTIPQSGYVYLLAGTSSTVSNMYLGDGGLASSATFNLPRDLALDLAGDIYIADSGNHVVRKISVLTGIISTIAGNGTSGNTGNGGTAANATLAQPVSLGIDELGQVLIADSQNAVVRAAGGSGQLIFGTQTVGSTSSPLGIVVTNHGNQTLHFSSSAVVWQGGSDFAIASGNQCGVADLAPGDSCTLYVTFTPSTSGTRVGSIALWDDGVNPEHAVALQGGSTSPLYYDTPLIGSYTDTCVTGAPEKGQLALYDSGDHQHYLVEPVWIPGKTYSYLVKDGVGVNVDVEACSNSGGVLGPGCSGYVYLPRPVVPGITTLTWWSDKSVAGEPYTEKVSTQTVQIGTATTTNPWTGGTTTINIMVQELYVYMANNPSSCPVYTEAQGPFQNSARY